MPRQLFYPTMPLLLHLLYPVSESTFQVLTQNPKPFCSPSTLRSALTQLCALPQGCAAFRLGFHISCLHRHVGAPTGWYPNVIPLFTIFWIFWSKMKIIQADAPPPLPSPPFLCLMPFLAQPLQFILAWDRHQICWLAYPEAWVKINMACKIYSFTHVRTLLTGNDLSWQLKTLRSLTIIQ